MATETTTTFTNLAKRIYGPAIENTLYKKVVLLDALEEAGESEVQMGGQGLYWPVETRRNGGVGFVAENAATPTPGNVSGVQALATTREIWGTIELTKKVMEETKGSEKAFVGAMSHRVEGVAEECRVVLNRALYGNKVGTTTWTSGIIALVNTTPGVPTTTVLIDNGHPTHFYPGQEIRIGTAAEVSGVGSGGSGAPGEADGCKVVSVAYNTSTSVTTLTVDRAITYADNDLIVPGDDQPSTADNWNGYDQEIIGIDAICRAHDDDLYGVDTGVNPQWKATTVGDPATPVTLTRGFIDAYADAVVEGGDGEPPSFWIGHSSVVRAIQQTMDADVRYTPIKFKGGFDRQALTWMVGNKMVPILSDARAPLGTLYSLRTDKLKIAYTHKWGWLDDDGAVLSRVNRRTAFDAVYGAILQLVCFKRNVQGALRGINTDNQIVIAG